MVGTLPGIPIGPHAGRDGQALQLRRSPLDRVCGTATLWLDTAGARVGTPALRIRFLPSTEAQALYAHLAAALARRRLRW